ncbi:MAG: ChaN family lipoprotein [Hyphomicrobiales bacterium]
MLKTVAATLIGLAALAGPAFVGPALSDSAPVEGGPWTSALHSDHPLVGRIWSRATGGFVDRKAVEAAIAPAKFVLLGEVHTNADHHRLQGEMISSLVAAGRKPTVVFEMIGADYADKLAAYLATPDATAEGFGPAVDWSKRGWPEWSLYQPVAAALMAAKLEARAGDLGKDTQRAVGKEGFQVLGDRVAALALDRPLEGPLADDLLDELFKSHCELVPREAMAPMAGVQRARDASMADAMIAAGGDGAVLIAGGGHARLDRGVPWYLRARAADASVVVVNFSEVDPDETDPAAYAARGGSGDPLYDFVWFTPKSEDKDHCAELRKHFEKKKAKE